MARSARGVHRCPAHAVVRAVRAPLGGEGAAGDVVAAGQPIGLSGASGRVTGAHLHIQVCRSAAFPTDIAMSADRLSFVATVAPGTGLEARVAALEARTRSSTAQALVAERFERGGSASLDADITLVQRAG